MSLGLIASAHVDSGPVSVSAAYFSGDHADRYTRSASGLSGTDFTWCSWFKYDTLRSYGRFLCVSDISGSTSPRYNLGQASAGGEVALDYDSGGLEVVSGLSADVWYFAACVYQVSGIDAVYYRPVGSPTLTQVTGTTDGPTGDTLWLGTVGWAGYPANVSLSCVRLWTAALTKAELEAEMLDIDPVRTSDLWAAYSFRNGPQTNDESGNGRTLTLSGTITEDEDGPDVS